MKKFAICSVICAAACLSCSYLVSADTKTPIQITDITHSECDEFDAVLRSAGNYKGVHVYADYTSHLDGSLDISFQTDSLMAIDETWQIIIADFFIPENYTVDFSKSFYGVDRDFALVDDAIVFYGEGNKTNIIGEITISGQSDKDESVIVCESEHKIYREYDDEQTEYVKRQQAEIDRLIELGLEHTVSNKYNPDYDLDGNGVVTINDAVKILRFISEI